MLKWGWGEKKKKPRRFVEKLRDSEWNTNTVEAKKKEERENDNDE